VRAAGGVAALAHPVFSQDADAGQRVTELPARLDAMVTAGLQAIECAYPDATPELSGQLVTLADARALIRTGGSDYHGPGKAPDAPLGQVTVDRDVVEALRRVTSVRPAPRESRT
jgi:predicted metal-dependent phosphoesterase TrpH